MAETYEVNMSIRVMKVSNKEILVDEETFFGAQSFQKLANLANDFFELMIKLKKLK